MSLNFQEQILAGKKIGRRNIKAELTIRPTN